MKPKPPLYHLTHPDNVGSILRDGIKANDDGEIFAFTCWMVADSIAGNQLGLEEFAVFRIYRKRISFELLPDNVAEFEAPFQRIIKMDRIPPRCLKLIEERKKISTIYDPPTPWEVHLTACRLQCKSFSEAYERAKEQKEAWRRA